MVSICWYRKHLRLLGTLVISLVVGVFLAIATNERIEQHGIAPAIDWWGTMYLNRILGQPDTGGPLELDPDMVDLPTLMFGKRIAMRSQPLLNTRRYRYDVYFVGFRPAKGWPFVSKTTFVDVFVDEFDQANKCLAQHTFQVDGNGASPFRWQGFIGNAVAFSTITSSILISAALILGVIKRRHSVQSCGFPVDREGTERDDRPGQPPIY